MFGDLQGMMSKLRETQQKIIETKKRLDTVLVEGTSSQEKISITVTANSVVKSISIDNSL